MYMYEILTKNLTELYKFSDIAVLTNITMNNF